MPIKSKTADESFCTKDTTDRASAAAPIQRRSTRSWRPRLALQPRTGLFFDAARRVRGEGNRAELVRVYEKVRAGIWVFNGVFRLFDAWAEQIDERACSSSGSRSPRTSYLLMRQETALSLRVSFRLQSSSRCGSATGAVASSAGARTICTSTTSFPGRGEGRHSQLRTCSFSVRTTTSPIAIAFSSYVEWFR
jgi:hypothetical protein